MPPSPSTLPDRAFRYRLTLMVWSVARPVSVAELVVALTDSGHLPEGRPSKVVSDALRWEVRRGRIRRVGRGLYTAGRMPPSTLVFLRRQVSDAQRSMPGSFSV
jgi:hypothetical protein